SVPPIWLGTPFGSSTRASMSLRRAVLIIPSCAPTDRRSTCRPLFPRRLTGRGGSAARAHAPEDVLRQGSIPETDDVLVGRNLEPRPRCGLRPAQESPYSYCPVFSHR